MAAKLLVVLLTVASTCQGKAITGNLDKSFDFLGLHAGLKYKDATQPLKGGKFQLVIDDLKKYIHTAHSNKVQVFMDFDAGNVVGDGLFTVKVDYSMVHSDGDGEEKGNLLMERKQVGNLWTTTLKTTTENFGSEPIIPKAISNMELKVESDRQTKLHAKYVNPTKNRDFHLNIDRVPGKSAKIEIVNGPRKHELTFKAGNFNLNNPDGNFKIEVVGTSLGEPVKGKIEGKKGQFQQVQFELERGNKKFLQVDTKVKVEGLSFEARTKYAILGGSIAGKFLVKFENNVVTLKNTDSKSNEKLEMIVKVVPGDSLHIETKKNDVSMLTYDTKRTKKDTASAFEMTLDTKMTLNSKSMIHAFLAKNYPYGAFNTRHNQLKVFVDRKNKNKLAQKFKVEINLHKDGAEVVDFKADTTVSPYEFHLKAPNFFNRWGINKESIDITVDHKIGSSLTIDANILGGLHLEAKRGDNSKGGRDISVLAKKGTEQMFKLTINTEKVNNGNEFKFILKDTFEVSPNSLIYKNIISQYKLLTPFKTRSGEFEFYINKKAKNVVLNKFYAKGKVTKDGKKAMELLLTTNEKPYKFELFAPALFKNVRPGMTEAKISIEHNPGQSLEMKTNFQKFTGFKISKTGSGNARKVEVNGKELATGDYTLTDNSFSTEITVGDDFLKPKITWEGKLPSNAQEAEAFMLQNNVHVTVAGSKRNLDLSLNWKMSKPDFDFGTPENGKLSLNVKGNNPRWGDYSLIREIEWEVANKVLNVRWTGAAKFQQGRLATSTPIETSFKFKVIPDQADLIGKFKKVINGKEYSIEFPKGSGVMPKIIMGQ